MDCNRILGGIEMATFSYTLTGTMNLGGVKATYGTYTNADGAEGGDIVTGLNQVKYFSMQSTGSAVVAAESAITETHIFGGTVTVVNTADADGIWLAIGA
jgi:hypothetical protein